MSLLLALLLSVSSDDRWLQQQHAFDDLLNCWADQWPGDVPTPNVVTPQAIAEAARLTRKNCHAQIRQHRNLISVELGARAGVAGEELEKAAAKKVETDIDEMSMSTGAGFEPRGIDAED